MKVWALTEEFSEGKYLVVRRDGTTPAWPHFVLGANDPCTKYALWAYAQAARTKGLDPAFADSVEQLAQVFMDWAERNATTHKKGDPDAPPHRKDNPTVLAMMRHETDVATLIAEHQALSPPPAGGVGWKLVPRDLIREMWAAGGDAQMRLRAKQNYNHDSISEAVWQAVWDAAPAQPEAMPGREEIVAELCEALLSDLDLMRQAIASNDPKVELLERVKMMKEEIAKVQARGAAG